MIYGLCTTNFPRLHMEVTWFPRNILSILEFLRPGIYSTGASKFCESRGGISVNAINIFMNNKTFFPSRESQFLHDSGASVCLRCLQAGAYFTCLRRRVAETLRPLVAVELRPKKEKPSRILFFYHIAFVIRAFVRPGKIGKRKILRHLRPFRHPSRPPRIYNRQQLPRQRNDR